MHNLLDDLRKAPTPLITKSKVSILKAIKEVHLAVLKQSLNLHNEVDVSQKAAALRRYAIWLEDLALEEFSENETKPLEKETISLFSSAATIYELVGSLSNLENENEASIFYPPLNDYLRGSILASFTSYQAHSTLLGNRIKEAIRNYEKFYEVSPQAQFHIILAEAVAAIASREFQQAFTLSQRLLALITKTLNYLRETDATNQAKLEFDKAAAIGRICGDIAIGMLIGITPLLSRSVETLIRIRDQAQKAEDPHHYWLADRLALLIGRMAQSSMHSVLEEKKLPIEYRELLARDGYLEFWGPQLEAIEKGLIDSDSNFVISIPTGSGKTMFAELGIFSALRDGGWAMYVAPSRALVNQVSGDLRNRLERCGINIRTIIAGAEQSAILDEEIDLIQLARTVTVTTPEKLDAYYRNAKEIFDSCRLIIFDEVHKIGDIDRGILIESLIARFLTLQPTTRIILLSGVMSNAEELKSWLGDDTTVSINEQNRPTRRVYGVAVRTDSQIGEEKKRQNGQLIRRVDFNGGLVIVHEREDLDQIKVDLLNLFKGNFTEYLFTKNDYSVWREDKALSHTSFNEHASQIAQSIVATPGTIIVFMNTIDSVQKGCREFNYSDHKYRKERKNLSKFISVELGKEHPLAAYCLNGYAYHHARLPNGIQRAIELALERGWLKVVFATATLREGINSPATTVIIAGNSMFDDLKKRPEPINESDFANLAGRAGRPRTDTEGRVLLVPDSLVLASAKEVGKKYILAGEAALRVKSQIIDLASLLIQTDDLKLINLPPNYQSILLGLEAAGLSSDDEYETFINHSLWALQSDEELLTKTSKRIYTILNKAREEVGTENIKIASKIGLSLSSSELLREILTEKLSIFTVNLFSPNSVGDQIHEILLASLNLPEVRKGFLKKDIDPDAHYYPLIEWISGNSYHSILEAGIDGKVLKNSSDITAAVKYASDMSNWLSWSFGAAFSVLKNISNDIDPYLSVLPLLIKYGVPTQTAAYISLLSISDRTSAQILGTYYDSLDRSVSLKEISDWLDGVSLDEIKNIMIADESNLRTELISKQIFRGRGTTVPYQIIRFRAIKSIRQGSILAIVEEGEELVLVENNEIVGTLIDDLSIFGVLLRRLDRTSAIPLESLIEGKVGKIALLQTTII